MKAEVWGSSIYVHCVVGVVGHKRCAYLLLVSVPSIVTFLVFQLLLLEMLGVGKWEGLIRALISLVGLLLYEVVVEGCLQIIWLFALIPLNSGI